MNGARLGLAVVLVLVIAVTAVAATSATRQVGPEVAGRAIQQGQGAPQLHPPGLLFYAECRIVRVTVGEPEAAYTNRFFRRFPGNDDQYLLDDNGQIVTNFDEGTIVDLGQVQAGEALILGIHVLDTEEKYVSGPVGDGRLAFEDHIRQRQR